MTMAYSDFVETLKDLRIKKKGMRPKMNPNRFYPAQAELQTQELLRDELSNYSYRLQTAAQNGGVKAVYDIPGAVPEGFEEKVSKVANEVSLFQVRAFSNFSELSVGERYFPNQGDKETIITTWTENFVNLCKSTNEEMRKKVAGVVSDGVLGGRNIRDITKDIQNTCGDFTRNKAELIATTEVGKLNTAIARNQSESAGIEYYEWAAAMDGRTRESHAVMDGKICKWGDDTHYYVWSAPDPKTGKKKLIRKDRPENAYKGAPGTDFRCRCIALPYVPEFEDDYEAEREKGPVRGVVQQAPEEEPESAVPEKKTSEKYSELVFDKKFDSLKTSREIINYMAKKHGIKVSSSFGTCNVEKLRGAFQGVDVVLGAFPEAKIGEVVKKSDGRFIMAACWNGENPFFIEMNNMYLRDDDKVREFRQDEFHPKKFGSRQSGAHEMGHIVNFWIARKEKGKMGYGGSNAESIAKEITKKAANTVAGKDVSSNFAELLKMRKAISGYADMSYDYMETVAEAFGDVVENRDNANPLSKEIYRLVRERYGANFGSGG